MRKSFREFINSRFLHPTSTGISNIPSLDGIRGVAIIMVVYCHFFAFASATNRGFPLEVLGVDARPYLMAGSFGVRLFFILSAFLLSMPYIRKFVYGGGDVPMARFYKRRALRIIPAYFAVIALYTAVVLLVGQQPLPRNFTLINLVSNAVFVHPFLPFVDGISSDFIPGTWSLVTEIHFYLMLPFVVKYFCSLKRAAALTFAALVLCFLYRAAVNNWVESGGTRFILVHNILGHFDLFALGMFASLVYFKKAAGEIRFPAWSAYLMLLVGFFLYWWKFNGGVGLTHDAEPIMALSFTFVLLGMLVGGDVFRRAMEWPVLRFIGLISYSMFLLNLVLVKYAIIPVMDTLGIKEPLHRFAFNMGIGLPVLLVLSTVSYLYIERPFLVKKTKAPTGVPVEKASVEVSPPGA